MNEETKKYIVYGICAVAAVFAVWFMFRDIRSNDIDVNSGFTSTANDIDNIQRGIDDSKGTAESIGRSIDDSAGTVENIAGSVADSESANSTAQAATGDAATANGNAENAVDRGIRGLNESLEIIARYTEIHQ